MQSAVRAWIEFRSAASQRGPVITHVFVEVCASRGMDRTENSTGGEGGMWEMGLTADGRSRRESTAAALGLSHTI